MKASAVITPPAGGAGEVVTELSLPVLADRVWRAVTDPALVARWFARLDSTLAPNLPTAYAKDQITLDFAYWAKNGPAIATRWNEWLVK